MPTYRAILQLEGYRIGSPTAEADNPEDAYDQIMHGGELAWGDFNETWSQIDIQEVKSAAVSDVPDRDN